MEEIRFPVWEDHDGVSDKRRDEAVCISVAALPLG